MIISNNNNKPPPRRADPRTAGTAPSRRRLPVDAPAG